MDEDMPAAMTAGHWAFASPWASYYNTGLRPPAEHSLTSADAAHARNEALQTMNQLGDLVYACRVPGRLIKIGFSRNLKVRRDNLKGELLAVMFGSYDDEQAIHEQLVEYRHHGREWYHPAPPVVAVVNEMRASLARPPIAG